MYMPFGSESGIGGRAEPAGLDGVKKEKKDFFGG
jgi:hypothetical protein